MSQILWYYEIERENPPKTPKSTGKFWKYSWSLKTEKSTWVVPFELFLSSKKCKIEHQKAQKSPPRAIKIE